MKYPEGLDPTFDETRVRLGSAVRRLGHAVIGREVDLDAMEAAIQALDGLSNQFEQGIARTREFSQFSSAHDNEVPDDSRLTSHITRPGSGPGSPHGLEMQVHRRGDRVELFQSGHHLKVPRLEATEASLPSPLTMPWASC